MAAMKRSRDYEDKISSLEREVETLNGRIDELTRDLSEYKAKEQAIVEALTEAHSTASRLIYDARMQVKSIYDEADKYKESFNAKLKNEQQECNVKIAKMIDTAHDEANIIVADANFKSEATLKNVQVLIDELAKAANDAKSQSERFNKIMENSKHDADVWFSSSLTGNKPGEALAAAAPPVAAKAPPALAAPIPPAPPCNAQPPQPPKAGPSAAQQRPDAGVVIPLRKPQTASAASNPPSVQKGEDYESTAELMHSIYKLQGRDVPRDDLPDDENDDDDDRVWTVDEIINGANGVGNSDDDTKAAQMSELDAISAELDAIIDDVLKEK